MSSFGHSVFQPFSCYVLVGFLPVSPGKKLKREPLQWIFSFHADIRHLMSTGFPWWHSCQLTVIVPAKWWSGTVHLMSASSWCSTGLQNRSQGIINLHGQICLNCDILCPHSLSQVIVPTQNFHRWSILYSFSAVNWRKTKHSVSLSIVCTDLKIQDITLFLFKNTGCNTWVIWCFVLFCFLPVVTLLFLVYIFLVLTDLVYIIIIWQDRFVMVWFTSISIRQ